MLIKWLGAAENDLKILEAWYLENAPEHLADTAQRLFDAGRSLASLPLRGRPGLVDGTRELLVPGLPYMLVYVVLEDSVAIVRLLHQHRQWPEE